MPQRSPGMCVSVNRVVQSAQGAGFLSFPFQPCRRPIENLPHRPGVHLAEVEKVRQQPGEPALRLQVDPLAGTAALDQLLERPAARVPAHALDVADRDFLIGNDSADLAGERAPSWSDLDPGTHTVRSAFQHLDSKRRRPPAGVALAVAESGVDLGHVEGQGAAVGRLGAPHGDDGASSGYSICRAVFSATSLPSSLLTTCRLMSIPAAIPAEQTTRPLSTKRRSA